MTYLELVNEVLALLREREVSTVSENSYSSLIGRLVNQSKQIVEDRYDWSALRSTIIVPTQADISGYILTDAGKRSRFYRDKFGRESVWNDTNKVFLQANKSSRWMTQQMLTDTNLGQPLYFDINGFMADINSLTPVNPRIDLYPIPDGLYNIHFNMCIPQEKLADDGDRMLIPDHVVVLCAWSKAIRERGEDGGAKANEVYGDFLYALNTAISFDAGYQQDELESTVE